MRRTRRRSRQSVELIGFLDILSAVMVIILIVISVLALSLGSGSPQQAQSQPKPAATPEPVEPTPVALVELVTAGGTPVRSPTSFLLCQAGQVERHDPVSGLITDRWDLGLVSPTTIADEIKTANIYLAVAGSCFDDLDSLVIALRSTGSSLGYEPVDESARRPW
ncbi:MAG: hypothetical protein HQ527_10750 [Cyanobacteria bacterium]|nr:hypothetical protein [Cyanobacteria bacterium bin.51]